MGTLTETLQISSLMSENRREQWVRMLVPALVVFVILLPTLLHPPDVNPAAFSQVEEIIKRSAMPYGDWVWYPPGIYILYGMVAQMAGPNIASVMAWMHAIDVVFNMASGLLIALLCRRWGHPQAAWGAAAWFAAIYCNGPLGTLAQTATWANTFVLAAILGCFRLRDPDLRHADWPNQQRRAVSTLLAIGVCTGIATLLHFPSLLPILPFLGATLWTKPQRQRTLGAANAWWHHRFWRALVIGIGLALPVASAVFWLINSSAWIPFREIVSSQGLITDGSLSEVIAHSAAWLPWMWFPLTLVVAGVLGEKGWSDRGVRWMLIGLIGSIVGACVHNKSVGHSWQMALPYVAMLIAVGTSKILLAAALPKPQIHVTGLLLAVVWNGVIQAQNYRVDAASTLNASIALTSQQWPQLEQSTHRSESAGKSKMPDNRPTCQAVIFNTDVAVMDHQRHTVGVGRIGQNASM
jgi:hypothetical protein